MKDAWCRTRSSIRFASVRKRTSGFSLIEVTMAVFIVALGIVSVFAIFPLSLRQSDSAVSDTHEGCFAQQILGTMEANAASTNLLNWTDWSDLNKFKTLVMSDLTDPPILADGVQHLVTNYPTFSSSDPLAVPREISYMLKITDGPGPDPKFRRRAELWVRSTRYGGDIKKKSQFFVTEFVYLGM